MHARLRSCAGYELSCKHVLGICFIFPTPGSAQSGDFRYRSTRDDYIQSDFFYKTVKHCLYTYFTFSLFCAPASVHIVDHPGPIEATSSSSQEIVKRRRNERELVVPPKKAAQAPEPPPGRSPAKPSEHCIKHYFFVVVQSIHHRQRCLQRRARTPSPKDREAQWNPALRQPHPWLILLVKQGKFCPRKNPHRLLSRRPDAPLPSQVSTVHSIISLITFTKQP
jgi:hypothetical protein